MIIIIIGRVAVEHDYRDDHVRSTFVVGDASRLRSNMIIEMIMFGRRLQFEMYLLVRHKWGGRSFDRFDILFICSVKIIC